MRRARIWRRRASADQLSLPRLELGRRTGKPLRCRRLVADELGPCGRGGLAKSGAERSPRGCLSSDRISSTGSSSGWRAICRGSTCAQSQYNRRCEVWPGDIELVQSGSPAGSTSAIARRGTRARCRQPPRLRQRQELARLRPLRLLEVAPPLRLECAARPVDRSIVGLPLGYTLVAGHIGSEYEPARRSADRTSPNRRCAEAYCGRAQARLAADGVNPRTPDRTRTADELRPRARARLAATGDRERLANLDAMRLERHSRRHVRLDVRRPRLASDRLPAQHAPATSATSPPRRPRITSSL